MDHLQLAASLLARPVVRSDRLASTRSATAVSRPTATRRSSSSARCSARPATMMLHRLARYAIGRTDDVGAGRVRRDVRAVEERGDRPRREGASPGWLGSDSPRSAPPALAVRTHVPPLPQRWLGVAARVPADDPTLAA